MRPGNSRFLCHAQEARLVNWNGFNPACSFHWTCPYPCSQGNPAEACANCIPLTSSIDFLHVPLRWRCMAQATCCPWGRFFLNGFVKSPPVRYTGRVLTVPPLHFSCCSIEVTRDADDLQVAYVWSGSTGSVLVFTFIVTYLSNSFYTMCVPCVHTGDKLNSVIPSISVDMD